MRVGVGISVVALVYSGCGDDSDSSQSTESRDAAADAGKGGSRIPDRSKPDASQGSVTGSRPDASRDGSAEGSTETSTDASIVTPTDPSSLDGSRTSTAPTTGTTTETNTSGASRDNTSDAGSIDSTPWTNDGFGDMGQPCDPALGSADCEVVCIGLSDGSGVCSNLCSPSRACREPMVCNTIPGEDQLYDLCLPNATCGQLDYFGQCEGTLLQYCDLEGPVEVDCAASTSATGEPLTCGLIDEDVGYDCVPAAFTGGCGDETEAGRCDGDTLIYCLSQASGEIEAVDCDQLGLTCGARFDGEFDCLDGGRNDCGYVAFEGQCEGATLTYCDGGTLSTRDCGTAACEWRGPDVGYDCGSRPDNTGDNVVQGSIAFEKPKATPDGLGESFVAKARRVLVRALAHDGVELGRDYTDDDGNFEISFNGIGEVVLEISTVGHPNTDPFVVRDCPMLDCEGVGNVYTVTTNTFAAQANTDLGLLLINVAGGAGAFNIFEQFVRGTDFSRANFGATPPYVTARWAPDSSTGCGTSCFSAGLGTIFVKGPVEDADEFDDSVLLHEFGHFLEYAFSRSDSPGGFHDGSPTDPRLAWGEGYGTYVGARIAGSSLYIDTSAAGAIAVDISQMGSFIEANPNDIRGMNQPISEYLVAELLWHIDEGLTGKTTAHGSQPIFDVLGNYFPITDRFQDRGIPGVELVDFLDGWFCRGHGDQTGIRALLDRLGFPYDFADRPDCLD